MICNRCGAYVNSNAKYCKNCGEKICSEDQCKYDYTDRYNTDNCHIQQYNYSYNYSTSSTYGDDIYIQEYVGENYATIREGKFSFPAFLFGPLYLLYRKCIGYALFYVIAITLISILLGENLQYITIIILHILLGKVFNEKYMMRVEQKVDEIKQRNLDKTSAELKAICKRKGRTSFGYVLLIGFVFFFLDLMLSLYIEMGTTTETEESRPVEVEKTQTNSTAILSDTPTVEESIGNLVLYIMPEYQLVNKTNEIINYEYENNETKCGINIYKEQTNSTLKTEIDVASVKYNINKKDIRFKSINNTLWTYFDRNVDDVAIKTYVIKKDSNLYIIDYSDNNSETCKNANTIMADYLNVR